METCIEQTIQYNDQYKRALSSQDKCAGKIYKRLEASCHDLETYLHQIQPMKRRFLKLELHRTDLKRSFKVIDAKRIMDQIARQHQVVIPPLDLTVFSDHFAKVLPA